ncbi:MAG TPA: GDP-mannose 4,6-dehydratase [Acidimicrobiales bacterium]
MKALVTGAAGFVGRHLCAHLAAAGDTVIGIDRSDGPDLLDADALARTLAEVAPEVVYHLGGWSDVGASWDHPIDAFEANAVGTLNLLQACSAHGSPRVLAVSSADVYGRVHPEELPITEGAPFRPVTPYAASKIAADQLALQAWLGYGLEVLRIRAFNHLGPGQTTRFVAPALAERIARNEVDGTDDVPVGNLTPRRDITDVRDVVRAYRLLMLHGEPGEAYNVCTGRDLSIGELAERLVELAVRPMHLVADPALQRPVETPVLRGDPSRLHAVTGWEPEIDLAITLADVLAEQRAAVATPA